MKFLLLAPPKRGLAGHQESVPIGLGYLATALRRLGHEPDLQDAVINRWDTNCILAYIGKTRPDIVGITVYSQALRNVREVLDAIKAAYPSIITVIGGPHPSAIPEHAMNYLVSADYGVNGEGEIPLARFMPFLEGRQERLQDIPGLIWREHGAVKWNPKAENDNLDELGFPAWDLVRPQLYFNSPDFRDKVTLIHTSRGCPYGCGFCVKLGRKLRHHSIPKVYEQIQLLHQQYGVRHFLIGDEGFPINTRYLKDFCRYVIEKNEGFSYCVACGVRLNAVDDEMCELMKKAKFVRTVGVGIEAGSPRVRGLMKKNLPQETIYKGVATLRKHGFKVAANFILGFPGETKEEMEETIRLALKLKLGLACFAPFIPLPGADATNKLIETGELPKDFDFSRVDLDSVLYAPKGMTKKQVDNMRRKAVFLFNIQPHLLCYHITGGRLKWTIIKIMRIFLPQFLVPRPWRRYY